ncbi:4-hydroxy-tetrahydrodipicolinate reductase [Leifsonia sp. F6_8S_P_1B]|uniref:4-hydroxy-tetrahydrodipicolinate reductase n=1 Tax=Leifsonia williamsii TaxID=3035919 RepID=A0ABT8KE31_9MICO|nr:4-hydroxy-tetrahydrodipicolinate reductase [Leifsonia williamsii]MDN4615720.1 4-hydroxy-tetrahydrodipicolinate reductase [Leifsonia williamsii]
MTIRVALAGASGRLGSVAARLIEQADDLELVARLGSRSSLDEMLGADVLVDMTLPQVSPEIVAYAIDNGLNVLVGTSGWSADRILDLERRVAQHEGRGAVVIPNFSLGSALGTAFATVAARFFDSIEIVEAHGAGKVDSPSGTAVRTAELIGAARAAIGPVEAPHTDQRARGQQVASVPIHSLRMRGVVAQQQVILGGAGETLTITHDTVSPEAYEAGILLALRAAATTTGVIVGLDKLVDLGIAEPNGEPPRRTVREQ